MRIPLILFFTVLTVSIISDIIIYRQIRLAKRQWLKTMFIVVSAILYVLLFLSLQFAKSTLSGSSFYWIMWMLFTFASFFISKLFYIALYTVAQAPRIWHRQPWTIVSKCGCWLSFIIFFILWWSALITPKQVNIEEITIESSRLPKEFDGYRIIQFSDLHVGTFNNTDIVDGIVEEINALNPDLIVFTGDIVNRQSAELTPYISSLRQLKAKDGIVSILGNHDYGDYYKWNSSFSKQANMSMLKSIQCDSLNWTLLLNETKSIKRGNHAIKVIGVENWGEHPFPQYGNLNASYPDLNDNHFKILLSHNPNHWDAVVTKDSNIDLTLSGHTHAMQIMFSLGKYKFSPSALRYKYWQGLHTKGEQSLYVNIGCGEVAIPMRLGATPELTLITLKCKQ